MSLVEGGGWECYTHGFKTEDANKWNKHCSDGEHFDFGQVPCSDCGGAVFLPKEGVPFVPYENGTKNYNRKCEACNNSKFSKVETAEYKYKK